MQKRAVVFFLIIGAIFALFWPNIGVAWRMLPFMLHGAFPSLRYAQFHLKGSIFDGQGNPLDAVGLSILGERSKAMGTQTDSETTRYQVDKSFDLWTKRYSAVTLGIGKPGYYPEFFSFGLHGATPRDLRVVLQKQGTLTRLTECSMVMRSTGPEAGTLFDFDNPPKSHGRLDPPQILPDLAEAARQRPHALYMIVERDPEDHISLVNRPWPHRRDSGQYPSPKHLTLHLSDGAGGFLRYQPRSGCAPKREMLQAPDAGYQPMLELVADDLPVGSSNEYYTFFYFKVGGKYGRGRIGNAYLSKDHKSVELNIDLMLQPDGSRNLEDDRAAF